MSTSGRKRGHKSRGIDDRLVGEMFTLATVVSILAGLAAWMTTVNRWSMVTLMFTLSLMIIAWLGALTTLAVLCVRAQVKRSRKKTCERIEDLLDQHADAMLQHFTKAAKDICTAVDRRDLTSVLESVQQRPRFEVVDN